MEISSRKQISEQISVKGINIQPGGMPAFIRLAKKGSVFENKWACDHQIR